MEYQMEHSNECKKNFVAVYDGSSAIENLKAKFCSTVANDVMLDNGVGVVRMWADEKSRLSRFRMLFTSFVDRECFFFFFSPLPEPFPLIFHHISWIIFRSHHTMTKKRSICWVWAHFCVTQAGLNVFNANVFVVLSLHHKYQRPYRIAECVWEYEGQNLFPPSLRTAS